MRYKEYNKNKVLEKVILLFWDNSFKGCSINDIVENVGVNRFSLYHEFQNKEGILYASLQLYKERYSVPNYRILRKEGNLEEILLEFYLSFLQNTNKFSGCYFIHIATEMADEDNNIKKLLDAYLGDIEEEFLKLLQRNGELERAQIKATHLLGLFCTSMSFLLDSLKRTANKTYNKWNSNNT